MSSDFSNAWSCAIEQITPTSSCGLLAGIKIDVRSKTVRFPVGDRLVGFQNIGPADHFVDRSEAELGHDPACFFGDHEQVVDDMLGFAGELLAQVPGLASRFPLGKYSDGTFAS